MSSCVSISNNLSVSLSRRGSG